MASIDLKKLIISLVLPQLAGIVGAAFTASKIPTWYASLHKPGWTPPGWLFGPVWTMLYLLIGISFYLVWIGVGESRQKTHDSKKLIWFVFGLQLALNTLWSILFFGLQSPELALFEISLLWVAIAANIIVFFRINRGAGLLLVPYLLWVTFAAYLNLAVVKLN